MASPPAGGFGQATGLPSGIRALPFDPLAPNEETIAAMKAARRGELVTVGGVDELLADLHADD
jgi:hypothetical protein